MPNDPKKLLENLCSGLETFLGFNPSSKGYDGKGIVYSDLDRLCDAVMGFLYQVLKDVSEKQPYETGKEYLNTLVSSTLKSNLNSGHDGFCKAFPMVTVNVNRYNQAVKSSNESIKNKIQTFSKEMQLLHKTVSEIQKDNALADDAKQIGLNEESVKKSLADCQRKAENFTNDLDVKNSHNSNKDAINDFNEKLRDKIVSVHHTLVHEKNRLSELSKKDEEKLAATKDKITEALDGVKRKVNDHICKEVNTLVTHFTKKIQAILQKLNDINGKLKTYIGELDRWIREAQSSVITVQGHVDIILKEFDKEDKSIKPEKILKDAHDLRFQGDNLLALASQAKREVDETVKQALEAVIKMDGELKEDLGKVKTAVEGQVEEIKTAIGKLYKVVQTGEPDRTIEADKSMVKVIEDMKNKVGVVNEGASSVAPKTGLQGIVTGLKWKYTDKFKPGQFVQDVLPSWMDAILGKDDTVKGTNAVKSWIKQYVTANDMLNEAYRNEENGIYKALNEKIKAAITSQLTTDHIISEATGQFTSRQVTTIAENLQNVKDVCLMFASKLDEKLQEGTEKIDKFVTIIMNAIETAPGTTAVKYSYAHRRFLREAVRTTLISLCSTAAQAAEELDSILLSNRLGTPPSTSIAEALDTAHKKADELHQNLKTALGKNSGGRKVNHAAAVDAAIGKIKTVAEHHIGTSDLVGDKISELGKEGFEQYKKQVLQTPESLAVADDDPNKLEGTLPAAIKRIRDEMKNVLRQIEPDIKLDNGLEQIDASTFNKPFDEIKRNIDDLCTTIREVGGNARDNLRLLKDTYFSKKSNLRGSIYKIKQDLTDLQKSLETGLIKTTTDVLNGMIPTRDATITLLDNHVQQEVKIARNALNIHAQKQYIESLKELLTAFSLKVEKELEPLPRDIARDLTLGFKGFMTTFERDFITNEKSIRGIRDMNPKFTPQKESLLSQAASKFFGSVNRFLHDLHKQQDFTTDFEKIQPTREALAKLFGDLVDSHHFDHTFSINLDALDNAVTAFKPATYGDAKCPLLLNALKAGFTPLVEELKKAYVSSYSGRQLQEEELGHYAKICWTITPILYQELTAFKDHLDIDGWTTHKIYDAQTPTSSLHALFFRDNGYDVHRPENAEHGELNHRQDFNGSSILKHLTNPHELFSQRSSPVTGIPQSTSGSDELGVTIAEECGLIQKLYDFLQTYFKVCHLTRIDKPRAPCSVYEILVWCNGLQFNPVYEKLKAQVRSEFMKEDKERPGEKKLQPFEAHPYPIKYGDVEAELYYVSANSHAVLTAILGHGHKDGIYACEFSSNSLKLDYPTNMIQLLCTLFDLLKRLYHQLYFLLQQCQLTTQLSGWKDCHYGRYIGGSGWQCNTKQCPKQDCDQRHDQSGDQTGGQYPNCGVKSPLQSFLEDGLKGHLPHSVTARGSSLSCGTCGSTPGMPCRTPMGFADIGATASHTMMGQDIREVLYNFCGSAKSPLTKLCSYLNCLLPSAPKTLADMFSFYYHLTDRWGMHGQQHKQQAFTEQVKAANFGRQYTGLNVYHLFTPSHSALKKGHSDGSLGSLVCLSREAVVCGPFLRPIGHAIYETFSSKHADKYLSWIVYLTATFYDLLKKLYDECNSKCGSRGSNCHGKACIKECRTTSKHDPPRYHDRKCKSIVSCNNTMPTLAKYGFVLGDPERLNGSERSQKKRTCRDFCDVFKEAFEKDSHLVQFFKAIDNFMFTIRAPFLWMTVALWSLSLFYLICVMVGRLDVLHIRSHLRIPSSHKITAQSLLAAAQVGRLAKISYLQP
ncbi:hypothetical protein, conserved [Babesia bigemina]|uniref:C3H1-type domain-containing protein n=1 Tax=Babesia bigemina TaxID=5866 RepID=A0A061BLZ1_BABBI|nr:hypothetical protein, conserved [Babesia bigemina]CDR71891.1 hypothetical protein, conserved [Babesia bigemina]|eukprot:XP_012770833.1 hypothetical protein, conserved [Babesia bigemina]